MIDTDPMQGSKGAAMMRGHTYRNQRWRRRLAQGLGVLMLSGCMSDRHAIAEPMPIARPLASSALNVNDPTTRAQSADDGGVVKLRKQANTAGVIPVSNNTITPAPITQQPLSAAPITPAPITAEAQIKIVAMVGPMPIYESEVREALNQRLGELIALDGATRSKREREIFQEELKRIVERELMLDDMFTKIRGAKKPQLIEMMQDDAAKDADKRLRDFKKSRNINSDEEFSALLANQGLTLQGMRRQIERNFMMGQYIGNLIGPKAQRVSLVEVQDYYRTHPDEFRTEDRAKWQDIFIRYDKFPSPEAARAFAQQLVARVRGGEDFVALVKQFDQGDSSLRGGFGQGEKRGEIFPVEAEAIVFRLQVGEVGPLIELDSGIHIVRLAERMYAGIKPFNVQTQTEIRKKLAAQIAEVELKRVVEQLKRQTPVVYPER